MRRLSVISLLALSALSGCIIVEHPGPATCNPPTQARSQANYPVFMVRAGAFAAIPANDFGFSVTANSTGGYRVAWSDQGNVATCFSGIMSVGDAGTVVGDFDPAQTRAINQAKVQVSAANEIRFASAPGADVDGVDVVPSTDPLFLDLFVNGSTASVHVFFPDRNTGQLVVSDQSRGAFDPR